MEKAIVLVTIEPTAEQNVLVELKAIHGVIEAHFLYGPYDLYVKVEAESSHELQDVVLGKIRKIKGIRSTMTCFVAD